MCCECMRRLTRKDLLETLTSKLSTRTQTIVSTLVCFLVCRQPLCLAIGWPSEILTVGVAGQFNLIVILIAPLDPGYFRLTVLRDPSVRQNAARYTRRQRDMMATGIEPTIFLIGLWLTPCRFQSSALSPTWLLFPTMR